MSKSSIRLLFLFVCFLVFGLAWSTWGGPRCGQGGVSMVIEKKDTAPLERATHAIMERTSVPLDQLVLDQERFCHRDPTALIEEVLQSLMISLVEEGQQVPIEFYVDEDGRKILVKGHRRVAAMRLLAEKNKPGFSKDMLVE